MRILTNKKYFTVLIHLLGWIAFFVFPFVLLNFPTESQPTIFGKIHRPPNRHVLLPFFIINNLLFIVFFYSNLFYLLPELFYKQKKALYFIVIFFLLCLAVYLPPFIKAHMINFPSHMTNPSRRPFRNVDRMFGFLHFLIIWVLSSLICLTQRLRRVEQRNKETKVQKLRAELSYLKAQVNSHFLFNTLNNIYALSICQSDKTPDAILKLSAIMRYVTQDAEAEMVPLEKELDYLNNYIDLQRLRSSENLEIKFKVKGDTHDKRIAPLLLINFIENAFKHGVSSHHTCFVYIDISIIKNQLTMEVANKEFNFTKNSSTATGSNNTRRRLQLQYAGKHLLSVNHENELHKITLQLNLS